MKQPPPEFRNRIEVLTEFAQDAATRGEHMFYIRIPAGLRPLDRGEVFEDPLQDALTASGLGEVTGGGSQLGERDAIEYCGIDVVVNDRDRGLEVIRSTMKRLAAPPGTVIEEFVPEWMELTL